MKPINFLGKVMHDLLFCRPDIHVTMNYNGKDLLIVIRKDEKSMTRVLPMKQITDAQFDIAGALLDEFAGKGELNVWSAAEGESKRGYKKNV